MSKIIRLLTPLFFIICLTSCKKNSINQNATLAQEKITPETKVLPEAIKIDLQTNIKIILTSTQFILSKVAASNLTDAEITIMDDQLLISRNIVTKIQMDSLLKIYKDAGLNIKNHLENPDNIECTACKYTSAQRGAKLVSIINYMRKNQTIFNSQYDKFMGDVNTNVAAVADNPGCHFGFYVCLAAGSGASGGIAIAAVVYVCACAFCDVTPPGC